MMQKEKYELRFSKIINNSSSRVFYSCDGNININGSIILANLLRSISNIETPTGTRL